MVAIALPTTTSTTPLRFRRPLEAAGAGAGRRRRSSVVTAVIVTAALVVALGYLASTPVPTPGQAATTHVAAEGETMWSIAVAHAPAGEAATYVEALVAANGGAIVAPGQTLTLPVP